MNKLAQHADWLRTLQAEMNQAAHCKDEKLYSQQKKSQRLRHKERTALNAEILSLGSDTHTGDHTKACFTLSNGRQQSSTFLTSK